MKFKLHDALKDPTMKYPRAANRLLDLGMALIIVGGIACSAVMLGMLPDSPYFWPSFAAFAVGFVSFIASQEVAKLKKNVADDGAGNSPRLKLVK